jgi:hypothetical protein
VTNDEERVDTLTDDIARRMTEGAPAPDFTARMLKRIDERRQPMRKWRVAWVIAPLAAAAMVWVAVQVVRLVPDATGVPSEVRLQPSTPNATEVPSVVRPKPSLDVVQDGPERIEGRDVTRVPSLVRLEQDTTETVASTVDALAPPRLEVTPLDATPLDAGISSPESIDVEHLEIIAPIAVTPLDPDDSARPR